LAKDPRLFDLSQRVATDPSIACSAYADPQWTTFACKHRELLEMAFQLCRPAEELMPDSGRIGCYIAEMGWIASYKSKKPLDRFDRAIPWFTYPAIEFLSQRVPGDATVFEYGAGFSTIWWNQRVRAVVSCENNALWVADILSIMPTANVIYRPLEDGNYSDEIKKYTNKFDAIVIDGRQRVACAKNSVPALTYRGVIIWDNSDRKEYEEGQEFLKRQGFRHVDFVGLGPINPYATSTSIYYRDGNCLGL
jgi:hypothetical protein